MPKLTLAFLLTLIANLALAQPYIPKELKKLSYDERYEFVTKDIFPTDRTVYKDSLGVALQNINGIDWTEYYSDYYVNNSNEITECVIRKIRNQDKILWKRLVDYFQSKNWGTIIPTKTDCSKQKETLKEVLTKDQSNRSTIDVNIDKENLQIVLWMLENCPAPTTVTIGQEGMTAIFVVLQHSPRNYREKYFSLIKSSAQNGDLSLQEVALFEDRLLMESGEKQKYGTQIVPDQQTGLKKLYPLVDPRNVNARRKAMGMGAIEDYLKRWNIEFKAE